MLSKLLVYCQQWLPTHLISRVVGRVAKSEQRWISRPFIRTICRLYAVDLSEAAEPDLTRYRSFNAFFTRALKPGARPLSGPVSSPCDGTVSALGPISDGQLIQAKGSAYSLADLLPGQETSRYHNGSFITIYLAPRDYHRVHVPCDGELRSSHYIPGRLFSVNEATTLGLPRLFARNERLACEFADTGGSFSVIMVGALIVAGIRPVWRDNAIPPARALTEQHQQRFARGDELGWFEMGSTVILVFPDRHDFTVTEGDTVRMGQALVSSGNRGTQSPAR